MLKSNGNIIYKACHYQFFYEYLKKIINIHLHMLLYYYFLFEQIFTYERVITKSSQLCPFIEMNLLHLVSIINTRYVSYKE